MAAARVSGGRRAGRRRCGRAVAGDKRKDAGKQSRNPRLHCRDAIQRSIFAASTSIGTAPSHSTSRWKSRTSNFAPSCGFGLATQRLDAQVADLVAERLAGPGDVALHLRDDVGLGERRVVEHVLDRLLAGPALGVQAGVHHETHRAQLLVVQAAEPLVGIGEHPELLAERLGVQRPALDVGRVAGAEAPEARQVLEFLLDRHLEVMARRRLVQRQRLHAELRLRLQVEGVDVEDAGPRTVRRRRLVVRARRRLRRGTPRPRAPRSRPSGTPRTASAARRRCGP